MKIGGTGKFDSLIPADCKNLHGSLKDGTAVRKVLQGSPTDGTAGSMDGGHKKTAYSGNVDDLVHRQVLNS